MATTAAILLAIAPEVSARADAATFLELAALQMTASAWGDVYALAVCNLAAHMATLSPVIAADSSASAGVAGPVTQERAGDLSVSYGNATGSIAGMTAADAALARTRYGLEFIRLRSTRAYGAARVVTV